jgi:hypothetical protein
VQIGTSGSLEQTPLPTALRQAAGAHGSGTMHVSGDPGGVVYLTGGEVSYIDTPAAPGLDVLVVRSGRVGEQDWLAAFTAGQVTHEVGNALVAHGLLGRRELEVFTLSAVFDASLCVLPMTSGSYHFRPGTRHWLGAIRPVGVDMLMREVARRQAMLDRLGGPALPQTATAVPVRRLQGGRVTITARQWEILMHANGQHSIRDLAWMLGRGVFAITVEIHRLITRGLLEIIGAAGASTADGAAGGDGSNLPQRRPGSSWPGQPPSATTSAVAGGPWTGAREAPATGAGAESFGQADLQTLKRLVDRLESLA